MLASAVILIFMKQLVAQLEATLQSWGVLYGSGSAMKIYEELEIWDNLLLCYRLLNKTIQADNLITLRLAVDPDNPRLLCALGDIRDDDECFRKAWECSGNRYARAQRSLANSALKRKNFVRAADCFKLALKISPLHPDAWFSLGYCCMKIGDDESALKVCIKTISYCSGFCYY